MIGAVPFVFPPKLLTISGLELGTEGGEFRVFERNDINDEACSGERVVEVSVG